MNNQFSQKVSDIIVYSKEEANRLKSSYIGPEHLLLGMLRDGEGKAIEILSKLKTNLTDIKKQVEAILKEHADDMLLPDADVPLSKWSCKDIETMYFRSTSDEKSSCRYGTCTAGHH